MSERVVLSRVEIERKLQHRYLGAIVTFTTIRNKDITGKVHRIAAECYTGEPMVIFNIEHTRYECDLQYFFENIIRHGNTSGRTTGHPGLQEGD